MSCDHGLTQIIEKDGMINKETRKITPCPECGTIFLDVG